MFLLGICFVISFIACMIFSMVTAFDAEHENNLFRFAFYVQRRFWQFEKDELNVAGRIICIIFMSFFLLPMNILLFVAKACMVLSEKLWHVFLCVFRNRNSDSGGNS